MGNELFIGALDLSPYLTQADFDISNKWLLNCWRVPEGHCAKLFCNPIIKVPFYLRWQEDNNPRCFNYAKFPTRINCADFLFLEYAPYVEITFMFDSYAGRTGHHIQTRLYLATGEGQ